MDVTPDDNDVLVKTRLRPLRHWHLPLRPVFTAGVTCRAGGVAGYSERIQHVAELVGWGWSPVRCARCSQENPGEARFCLHCGAPLILSCPSCGAVQPPGARFCPECGRAVAAALSPAGYTPAHIREQILAVRRRSRVNASR
jgi:hypothetical protein